MGCNICLDVLRDPFVTPCGHAFCSECLISSSQKSPDAMKAPCPTCRAPFSLVLPDQIFVPEKYRPLIDSNIRRLYLDDSLEISLQEKVAQLESRVKGLERDKGLLMGRCEANKAAAVTHAKGEKDARMQCIALQKELKEANHCVAQLVEKEVQKRTSSTPATHVPRSRSSLPAHPLTPDSSMLRIEIGMLGKRGSSGCGEQGAQAGVLRERRPAIPLPKRRRVSRLRGGPGM